MTQFRILVKTRPDGKARYYVQQRRFWLYWSYTYYYNSGFASYGTGDDTPEEAEARLQTYIKDTHEKIMSRPWNQVHHVIKHVEV
jgi:hypothetical protein